MFADFFAMTFYAHQQATAPHRTQTPQRRPLPGRRDMTENHAGGASFRLDRWGQLQRFLVLGTDRPTYYATAAALTRTAARAVQQCLAVDGVRTVREIVAVSAAGRAPKNDPALFALALAATRGDAATVAAAYAALPEVARIGTHLFQFVDAIDALGSWNAAAKRGIAAWYQGRSPESLAFQLLKYRAREGWSHRDVLRLAHVTPANAEQSALFRYVARGERTPGIALPTLVDDVEALHAAATPAAACAVLARNPRLTWEMMPTELQRHAAVWETLLPNLGYTALLRRLGQLSAIGLVTSGSAAEALVATRLADVDALRTARVHPITVLSAWRQYGLGAGLAGSLQWEPAPAVLAALEAAFYACFRGLPATGQRFVVGVDCSGSMWGSTVSGLPNLTAAEAAAVLAMVLCAREPGSWLGCFDTRMRDLPIAPGMRLEQVLAVMQGTGWGGTDCAQPIRHALQEGMADVDAFVVITDNETWAGDMHPTEALARYRRHYERPSRLVVCATTATEFSIADPRDAGMLDIAGFDAAAPELIQRFGRPFGEPLVGGGDA